jgi:SNF2 family DNA or RNA helicase
LAGRLGVAFATVNRWENGQNKPSAVYWSALERLESIKDGTEEEDAAPTTERIRVDFTAPPEAVLAVAEGERLTYGHLANPAFATEISKIDPLPHQRIAVYDQMLTQPRLRFLLSDDAGAGKTIMSGLYIRELLARRLVRRVLIVPPAGLVGNWQSELEKLFSLSFAVVSGADARTGNPFIGHGSDQVIVSVDTLSGSRVFAKLSEDGAIPYDLVIFDEAHKLSSNRGADLRVTKTDRYRLAEALAGVPMRDPGWELPWRAHHLVLLTATPHMGKDYPYYALWRLLEPDMLSAPEAFDALPQSERRHRFIRRTKEEMVTLDGKPLYPTRVCDTLGYELTKGETSEKALYDRTTDYLQTLYNKAKLLNRSAARLAMSVFQRRLASSTFALMCSFERRIEKLDDLIDQVESGRLTPEQLINLQRRLAAEHDDPFETRAADDEESVDGREEHEIEEEQLLRGVIATSLADLYHEKETVTVLRDLAKQVYDGGHESKFDKLREVLSAEDYASQKFIIFTEHRDTLEFLRRRLGGMGYAGQIAQIHGGMHYKEREAEVARFKKPQFEGGARFLVCTDAAGEGINLQFCWLMINYDVPWNPARLEQRMGRIHRYGQQHDPVYIFNLVAPETREGRVLQTLLEKLESIRKALNSDKVYDVIGRIFQGVSIKQYMDAVAEGQDPDEIAERLGGQLTTEQVEAIAAREARLFGTGGDVAEELPVLRESMEKETYCRLLPGYVRHYTEVAAPLVGLRINGDPSSRFAFAADRRGALDPLLPVLDFYSPELQERLSFTRPPATDPAVWLHPGEPLFDRFREHVTESLRPDALRGAIFADPSSDRPYFFHLGVITVVRARDADFSEFAQSETLESRLIGLKQYDGSHIELCPVEHLLLLSPGHGLPIGAQRMAASANEFAAIARAYLTERQARERAAARRDQLLSTLTERQFFLQKGFDYQESALAAVRGALAEKARSGNKGAELELVKVKNQQRELGARRKHALALIEREPQLIGPGDVWFIAHALVIPTTDPEVREQFEADVERVAMQRAWAWEESEGAVVKDVHTPKLARAAGLGDNPGFDLLSIRPDGERRSIEVKGRVGCGDVEISRNEWARAVNLGEAYWLYVIYDCGTPTPRLVRVQDPFNKLLAKAKGSMLISPREVAVAAET